MCNTDLKETITSLNNNLFQTPWNKLKQKTFMHLQDYYSARSKEVKAISLADWGCHCVAAEAEEYFVFVFIPSVNMSTTDKDTGYKL